MTRTNAVIAMALTAARNNLRAHQDYAARMTALPEWVDDLQDTRPSAAVAVRRAFAERGPDRAPASAPTTARAAGTKGVSGPSMQAIATDVQNWCSSTTDAGDTAWFC